MRRSSILLVDSIINFLIGILLLFFPRVVIEFLELPLVENEFYPSILGSVLIGIAIALFVEWHRKESKVIGLGTGGAILINLCAASVLSVWLLFGGLKIPIRGSLILWGLVMLVIVISIIEIKVVYKNTSA